MENTSEKINSQEKLEQNEGKQPYSIDNFGKWLDDASKSGIKEKGYKNLYDGICKELSRSR